jgi:hypothetical protein
MCSARVVDALALISAIHVVLDVVIVQRRVVEKLLANYLEQQRLERLSQHRISDATAAAWNTFNGEHGSIADEFSSL